MDPRNRADEALARSRARGAFVVTPDSATSPMDAAKTVRIPRESVRDMENEDPNSTVFIPDSTGGTAQHQGTSPPERQTSPERGRPEYGEDPPTTPHRVGTAPNSPHDPHRHPRESG